MHRFSQESLFWEIPTASQLQFLRSTVSMKAMLREKLFHTMYCSLNI